LLSADPNVASFTLTVNQALQGESIIAFNGLPPAITQALLALGADTTTLSALRGLAFVQNVNTVSGNFVSHIADPSLLNALNTLINTLGITVQISIKPGGGTPAVINPRSQGTIPVAILSSSTFNAVTQIDVSSLRFGSTGSAESLAFCDTAGEDVNGDGLLDLVCHFTTQLTGFTTSSTTAMLSGQTKTHVTISGQAPITIVP
jgi:hypothetical protein